MSFSLEEQTLVFLEAILLGVGGGLVYDLCRSLRRVVHAGIFGTALTDFAFWLFVLGALFYFAVTDAAAQMRVYVLLGEGLGMALYFLCFTPLLLPVFIGLLRLLGYMAAFLPRQGAKICALAEQKWKAGERLVQIFKKIKKTLPFLKRLG